MEAPTGGVDDMTKLSYLHEPAVLFNLGTRYEINEIYVRSISLLVLNMLMLTPVGKKLVLNTALTDGLVCNTFRPHGRHTAGTFS